MKKIIFTFFLFITLLAIYKSLSPKIIFVYPKMEKYKSIKVTNLDFSTEYLRPRFGKATYYFPYFWDDKSEGIIFMGEGFIELFKKEDINFCNLYFSLDENGKIVDIKENDGICIKPF